MMSALGIACAIATALNVASLAYFAWLDYMDDEDDDLPAEGPMAPPTG